MIVTSTRLTLAEFLQLPEEEPELEYVDGGVTQKMSPKGHHGIIQGELTERLNASARQGKTGRAIPELRVTFGGASVVPDVTFFRRERLPVLDDGRVANDFLIPPDIAIEIVSPQQSVNALVRRCLWYVGNGVQIALLVDPADESVLAFRRDAQAQAWRGSDPIDLHEILPGFNVTVERLFASLRQE